MDLSPYRAIVDGLDVEVRDVVVLPGRNIARTEDGFAKLLPDATIHVPSEQPVNARRLSAALARSPQPQLIVDRTNKPDAGKTVLFNNLFGFLPPGGAYVIDSRSSDLSGLLEEVTGHGQVTTLGDRLIVVHQESEHRYTIRESEANELLDARFGSRWGRVVTAQPPQSYASKAVVIVHGTRDSWRGELDEPRSGGTIDVPELCLRQYRDVTCWGQQRIARENYWLPDTFRHPLHQNLTHRSLTRVGRGHARLPPDTTRSAQPIEGPCFYFDSEYPAHFGHFLTEVLSRVWGWQEAVRVEPDVRPLIGMARDRQTIPTYQREIFDVLDVDLSDAVYVAPDECVQVESLYAATPAFVMPHYAAPALDEVWSSVAQAFTRTDENPPRLLFVARRVRNIRSCVNTEEVEAFFASLGFAVVYPEELDFAGQVSMFANAEVIAGFAGSGLFNMMFARDKTVIVISPDTYTATNEYLIASVTGAQLHYFLADAEIKHPPDGWRWAAYQSNFRFDVPRHAAEITGLVHR